MSSTAKRNPVYLRATTIQALVLAALANKNIAGGIGKGEYSKVVTDPKTGEATDCPICLIGQARFLDGVGMESNFEAGPVEKELRKAFEHAEREGVEQENDKAVGNLLIKKAEKWFAKGRLTWINWSALPRRAQGVSMPALMKALDIRSYPRA